MKMSPLLSLLPVSETIIDTLLDEGLMKKQQQWTDGLISVAVIILIGRTFELFVCEVVTSLWNIQIEMSCYMRINQTIISSNTQHCGSPTYRGCVWRSITCSCALYPSWLIHLSILECYIHRTHPQSAVNSYGITYRLYKINHSAQLSGKQFLAIALLCWRIWTSRICITAELNDRRFSQPIF